jgi:hypothetical protein
MALMEGPDAVVGEMVSEGLIAEEELGHLSPPVYFLDKEGHHKVIGALLYTSCSTT